MLVVDQRDTVQGLNQMDTLQRPGDTRWSSHLEFVSILIKMFNATCVVLLNIIDEGTTSANMEMLIQHKR